MEQLPLQSRVYVCVGLPLQQYGNPAPPSFPFSSTQRQQTDDPELPAACYLFSAVRVTPWVTFPPTLWLVWFLCKLNSVSVFTCSLERLHWRYAWISNKLLYTKAGLVSGIEQFINFGGHIRTWIWTQKCFLLMSVCYIVNRITHKTVCVCLWNVCQNGPHNWQCDSLLERSEPRWNNMTSPAKTMTKKLGVVHRFPQYFTHSAVVVSGQY